MRSASYAGKAHYAGKIHDATESVFTHRGDEGLAAKEAGEQIVLQSLHEVLLGKLP